jgi:hypothetical protein
MLINSNMPNFCNNLILYRLKSAVQWSVLSFIVIPSLVITNILTTTLIEILITDVDNKCLLHPSAVISIRSNVCVRPEDGYNMSRNMSPM